MAAVGRTGGQLDTPPDFRAQNLAEVQARALAEAKRFQAQLRGLYAEPVPQRPAGDRPATPEDWAAMRSRTITPKRPQKQSTYRLADPIAEQPQHLEVRIDPELGRLAIGLDKTPEFRIWCILRHHFGDPGWTDRNTLYDSLQADGVTHTKRHFRRLLKAGENLFWNLSPDGRVWLRSYVKVAERLTHRARQTNPDLVATNIPGVRDVYLRVDGDLQRFKARLYAGWMAHREAPKIARATLETLFGVSADTLRNWEERLGEKALRVIPNYAQTAIDPKEDDTILDYLPEHAYSYLTTKHEVRMRWQQPNTYRPTFIRQHPRKGQSRKARIAAAVTAWNPPVERCASTGDMPEKMAFDRSHRVPRQYFATATALRKFMARMERRGEASSTPETPRYVFLGHDRNDYGIWELSLDGEVRTSTWERISIKKEYLWRLGQRRLWQGYISRSHRPRIA
jgi:hypothetical protein